MKTRLRRDSAAFTLIEMLAAVVLLTVFMLLAAQLFISSMRLIGEATKANSVVVRLDGVLGQLRRDAWDARNSVVDGNALHITSATGAEFVWKLDGAGATVTLTRTTARTGNPPEVRTWKDLPGPMHFEVRGPTLVVMGVDTDGKPAAMVMTSQWLLAGGKP